VLEVNASCGLGKGSSSEFILHLAGQTTQDFFKIILSTNLDVSNLIDLGNAETPLIPAAVQERVSKLIDHPSLAVQATPIVHVIVSAVLLDSENHIPDPEGKLSSNYGKDAEYVSELENIFRSIGLDPIVHLFHVDNLETALGSLDKQNELLFNACLGSDGFAVASILDKLKFKRTVGLNARFFEQSSSRPSTRQRLAEAKLSIPRGILLPLKYDKHVTFQVLVEDTFRKVLNQLEMASLELPIYIKPGRAVRHHDGQNSGRMIASKEQLRQFLLDLFTLEAKSQDFSQDQEFWILEEYISGNEFRVLVAGDGRDPNLDVIVFPPIKYLPELSSTVSLAESGTLFGSNRSLLLRKDSARRLDKENLQQANRCYIKMKDKDLILQMDIQDLARRAYSAVHGSCYGLVHVVQRHDTKQLVVIGVHGDVRFGDNAKAGIVMRLAGLVMSDLFQWLIQRAS
jgi:hypothetical protein